MKQTGMLILANHQLTLENCQIVNLFGTMSMYDV